MKTIQFPPEIGTPGIDHRPTRHTVGLRIITPFEGMFAQTDKLFKELRQWVNAQDLANQGPYFLRYHVIDMQGLMDVEAGFVVTTPQLRDERVNSGVLPAGRYAHLTYSRYALRGNQALLLWVKEQQLEADGKIRRTVMPLAVATKRISQIIEPNPKRRIGKLTWQSDCEIKQDRSIAYCYCSGSWVE